jgi:C4-type Zn-finger protein
MYSNFRKVKSLNKHCPECGIGQLAIIEYTYKKDGVDIFESFEECNECDYSVKVRMKRKDKEDDRIEYGW